MEIKTKKLSDLKPAPYNPRTISDKAMAGLRVSIDRFGLVEPIVFNKRSGNVIGGHQRLKVLEEQGVKKTQVVVVDLTKREEKALNVTLNNPHVAGDFVPDLQNILEGFKVDIPDAFEALNLDELYNPGPKDGATDPDAIPESAPATVKIGEIWQLGKHRVMCGDSTKAEDVDALMDGEKADMVFTSPPYNAGSYTLTGNVKKKDKSSRYDGRADDLPEDEYVKFLNDFTSIALGQASIVAVNIQQLANNKFAVLKWISGFIDNFVDRAVWYKGHGNPAMAENVMASRFEDIWILSQTKRPTRAISTAKFRGTIENVFQHIGAQSENKISASHAATMPIALAIWALESWTILESTIYEPFLGSGTTLVACEQLDRICYGMEIEPKYCDVIIKRWEEFTGETATKAA